MKDAKIIDAKNIRDFIARAVALRKEIDQTIDVKDKFAKFTYLFPTLEDKMICKAIFDVKFTGDIATRKFISQMIDGINGLVPQKMTEMIDLYNQVSALAYKQKIKDNKLVSDSGGERSSVEGKQGTLLNDDKHGRIDNFNSSNNDKALVESFGGEIISQKGDSSISVISKDELSEAKRQNEILEMTKNIKQELDADEKKKREAYEQSLAERRNKQEYAKIAGDLQRILNYEDKN